MVGLPVKNGIVHPLYDYEDEIKEAIESYQHIWIKKARGLGVTEFMIRYLAWCCLASHALTDKSIFIIAGTREEFANEIKERMERLFRDSYPHAISGSKYTEMYVGRTRIKVFPTKNLKDVRGRIDVSYLFIDEADFFDLKEQNELKYVIKSYEEKSKGKIIMVSTANEPNGLFDQIEQDPNSDFHKMFMLVDKGRGKIFDDKFLEEQKAKDPAFFQREYEGMYGFGVGNIFLPPEIEWAVAYAYDATKINQFSDIYMGIDPGFGSSKFAICVTMLEDSMIKVMYASEFDRASFMDMISLVGQLRYQYHPTKIFIDGANPAFIKAVKADIGENQEYDKQIELAKAEKIDYAAVMSVVPVNFATEHKEMLGKARYVISKKWVAIDKKFKGLLNDLRIARIKENGNLDKDTNTMDSLDAFRLSIKGYDIPMLQ